MAREAGYTRGALYQQFKDKEDLVLSVVEWAFEAWREEVGFDRLTKQQRDPVGVLLALARGHAVYCRRDVARRGAGGPHRRPECSGLNLGER